MNKYISQENTLLFMVFSALNLSTYYALGPAAETISYVADTEWSTIKLLTTHFSHHNEMHLWGNVTAMALLLTLFPTKNICLILAFLLCILVTALYVIHQEIEQFLGASALLYCIPGCQYANALIKKQFIQANIILTTLWLYLFIITPTSSSEEQNWLPFTAAHAIGFLAGVITQLLITTYAMEPTHIEKNQSLL